MTLSSAPWWCAPVLALAWMLTVPAQIFCAPTRAKLIAAVRSMPGVCAVLGSSEEAGMTRTPSCFHLDACSWWDLSFMLAPSILLPAPCRAGEALGFLGGAEQRLGLVDAFLLLGLRIGIGDDAGAGLHVHHAVLDQRGAHHDAAVELAGGGEIADRAGVEPALLLLEVVEDLHRPHLGRARDRAGRKARRQRVERVVFAVEVALHVGYDVHHLAEALDEELLGHLDG